MLSYGRLQVLRAHITLSDRIEMDRLCLDKILLTKPILSKSDFETKINRESY
jgi:hypothetical protein